VGPVTAQVVKGNDPHRGRGWVCERDMAHVRVGIGWQVKIIVLWAVVFFP
jgi:hypothetical protein